MNAISIHLPDGLLRQMDYLAAELQRPRADMSRMMSP
jgi:predicted transcriptional regulator